MSRSLGRDMGSFLAGAALFGASLVLVRRSGIGPVEEEIFRAANDAPDTLTIPVRSVMQMGTFGSVPAVSAVALLAGKPRLAAALGVGGTAAWVLAKQAKVLGGRPRPSRATRRSRPRSPSPGGPRPHDGRTPCWLPEP